MSVIDKRHRDQEDDLVKAYQLIDFSGSVDFVLDGHVFLSATKPKGSILHHRGRIRAVPPLPEPFLIPIDRVDFLF